MTNVFDRITAILDSSSPKNKQRQRRGRACRIEELESREMLSADLFQAVNAVYRDINLGDDWEKYNIIEVSAEYLSAGALRDAITEAGKTAKNDLIVLHTDSTYSNIQLGDGLNINIDAASYGSVTIVSFGTQPLMVSNVGTSSVFNISSDSTVAMAGLTITGGKDSGMHNEGNLTVTNSTFTGNTALVDGGGIYNSGTLTAIYCTIQDNSAMSNGGGIYNSGAMTVANCLIVENTAQFGGGIHNNSSIHGGSLGACIVTNSTIAENEAAMVGGGVCLDNNSVLTLNNTIVATNVASSDGPDIGHRSSGMGTVSGKNNFIGIGNGNGGLTTGNGNFIGGTASTPNNPEFVDAANGDYRLDAGSAAIDKGNDDLAVVAEKRLATDLDGLFSRFNNTVDIGAYEYGSALIAPTPSATVVSQTIIRVTWNAIALADGYEIHYTNGTTVSGMVVTASGSGAMTTLDMFGLEPGTYTIEIKSLAPAGALTIKDSPYEKVTVDTTIVPPDVIVLETPVVTLSKNVDDPTGTVDVSWNAVTNADKYYIEWHDGTAWQNAVVVDNTYTLSGMANTTYAVYVTALTDTLAVYGNSERSQVQIIKTDDWTLLDTPVVTLEPGDDATTEIKISWEPVDNAAAYLVEFFTYDLGWTVFATTDETGTTIDGFAPNTVYLVRVTALTTEDDTIRKNSEPSTAEKFQTDDLYQLDTPVVILKPGEDATTEIKISWEPVEGAAEYLVEYFDGSEWKSLNVPAETYNEDTEETEIVTGIILDGLTPNTVYLIRITALIAEEDTMHKNSEPSAEQFYKTDDLYPLNTPVITLEDGDDATTEIKVSWDAVEEARKYLIEYSTDRQEWIHFELDWETIEPTEEGRYEITINTLELNTVYLVRVTALITEEDTFHTDSAPSVVQFHKTADSTQLYAPEVSLSQNIDSPTRSIDVSWEPVSHAAEYKVEYSTDGLEWQSFIVLAEKYNEETEEIEAIAKVTIDELVPNTVYLVHVTALVAEDDTIHRDSEPSAVKLLMTESVPQLEQPVIIGVEAYDIGRIKITWTAAENAEEYMIMYSGSEDFTTFRAIRVGASASLECEYMLSELEADTLYFIQIIACANNVEDSKPSEVVSARTYPLPIDRPTIETINVDSATSVSLSWTRVTGALNYEVRYSLDGGKTWSLGTSAADDFATIGNLAAEANYTFQVRAVKANGQFSPWSEEFVTIKTTPAENTAATAVKPKKVWSSKGVNKPGISTVTLNVINAAGQSPASYIVTCTSDPMLNFSYTVAVDKIFIEGLNPKTKYTFTVQMVNKDGKVSGAVTAKATTKKYTSARSLKVLSGTTTQNTITLTWNSSAAKAKTNGYIVEVWDASGQSLVGKIVLDNGSQTNVTINGLSAETRYTFVVRATEGPHLSAVAKVKASTLKYAAVNVLRFTGIDADGKAMLSWNISPNIYTTGYEVYYMLGGAETMLIDGYVDGRTNVEGGNIDGITRIGGAFTLPSGWFSSDIFVRAVVKDGDTVIAKSQASKVRVML